MTEVGPDDRVRVTCGLQHPISLPVPADMAVPGEGERVTVRVSSRRPVRARLVDEPPPGFAVERGDLSASLARGDAGVRIAASRHGESLSVSRLDAVAGSIRDAGGFTVAFGAPERGLPAILDRDTDAPSEETPSETGTDDSTREFDLWLDTVPDQGSEVVRTEEAMFATLAPLTLPR